MSSQLIHRERFFKADNIIPIVLLIIVWAFYFDKLESNGWIFVYTIIMIAVIFVSSRRKPVFAVFSDSIEFHKLFSDQLFSVLNFDQIDQVRYEDEFTESYGLFWSDFIIIYPKKNIETEGLQKDRISLCITGFGRKAKILKLLKFFQSKGIDVKLKTKSKKIKRETGLQNWDQAF